MNDGFVILFIDHQGAVTTRFRAVRSDAIAIANAADPAKYRNVLVLPGHHKILGEG